MIRSINLGAMNTRDEARKMVDDGLNNLRDGFLKYHELGLYTQDLYDDLVAAGWDMNKRTLQRLHTTLEAEGLLPRNNRNKWTGQGQGDIWHLSQGWKKWWR